MRIVNANDVEELQWESPSGRFRGAGRQLSEALGREPDSTDLRKRHPFDVELARILPGTVPFPFHAHSAQWEFYHVVSGTGTVRDDSGTHAIGPGDTFLFKPGEAHQLASDAMSEIVLLVVADNPIGEACFYPDSGTWSVPLPDRQIIRGERTTYEDEL